MRPVDHLPAQFLNYLLVWNAATGKWDKHPCLMDGTVVDAHDRSNWLTYDQAASVASYDHTRQGPFGVAFVLSRDDPWFFLDLDDCRLPDGRWKPEAEDLFMNFSGCLGEVSVSGKGLHVLGHARGDMLADRKNKWDGWLECYTWGRFVALGVEPLAPIGGTLNLGVDWTDNLRRIIPARPAMDTLTADVDPSYTGPDDDAELIAKMLASAGGAAAAFGGKATVKQLWEADPILCQVYPDAHGRPGEFDHSSADAALCSHLAFWTGKHTERMDRLFRQSALMRPKWSRDDYRVKTVTEAAMMCNRVYDRPRPAAAAAGMPAVAAPGEIYMSVAEMQQNFAGCVYISELHRILTPGGRLMKHEQFRAYYGGYMFQMEANNARPEKDAWVAFTENRYHRFPKVARAVYDPNREPGDIKDDTVNLFFRGDVDIRPGDISKFWDLFQRILPNEGDRQTLLSWMASCVQNPGRKLPWAPVLQGAEGNGKTFIANCVAHAVGERATHRPNAKEIAEKFNAYEEHSALCIVEEINMQNRREILDNLKPRITNPHLEIRGMGAEKRMVKTFSKWFFCTNYKDAVIKHRNDRRYAIYYTAQQSYEDIVASGLAGSYFVDLYDWAENKGGYAFVGHMLMNYQIPPELDPAGLCHRAPETSSTAEAIAWSMGTIESEVVEATEDGTRGFCGGFVSAWSLDQLLKMKGHRLSLNKRAEMMDALGYEKCPLWRDGRIPMNLPMEEGRRPVIYVKKGMLLDEGTAHAYCVAQGYAR